MEDKAASRIPGAAPGIDPLYESAIIHCRTTGRYTASGLQRGLKIGYGRGKSLLKLMDAAGMIPAPGDVAAIVAVPPPPTPHVRGHAAAAATKKKGDTIIHEIPEDIIEFLDMSIRDLIFRFGTDERFLDWLKAVKAIEDINEKRLKNARTKGELVSRELVKVGVIDPIEAAHIKMMTDGAKTIARRVTAMHGAGRPLEDVEKFVKEQITSFIRPLKSKIKRALTNA